MKLIIINGPTGIGKSTISKMIHNDLALSFLLAMDEQRRYISKYREYRIDSRDLVRNLSLGIIDTYLQTGHDVIIDAVIIDSILMGKIMAIGAKYNATILEFILNSDKNTLIERAKNRGYREGGLLTPKKVIEFWENIHFFIKERTDAIVIDTTNLKIEDTYKYIQSIVLSNKNI
jgi:broad-specificity NMP kinase